MSGNSLSSQVLLCSILFVSQLFFAHAASAARSAEVEDVCAHAIPVYFDSTLSGVESVAGNTVFFEVEAPAAGILSIELTADGPVEPKLGLLGHRCCKACNDDAPVKARRSAVLERYVNHLVLVLRDGATLLLRGAAQDPRLALGEYRLTTRFVPLAEIKPLGGEDEEIIEIESNGSLLSPAEPYRVELRELCRPDGVDDHGDTLPCATFLSSGREIRGEISSHQGRDRDVFAIVLDGAQDRLWTVVVGTSGEHDTFGELYDRFGHRLAADDDGGDGANFRLAQTLGPGLYFVRVTGGQGAPGSYSLRLRTSPW